MLLYETRKKRFRRLEKASKRIQILKERVFNSAESLNLKSLLVDTPEEPFAEKTSLRDRTLKRLLRKMRTL